MTKLALLIGVSDYEPGLNSLPASIRDMQAIAKVLQHPEMGGFAEGDIQKLENPDPQKMQEAIETLFSDRRKDDLVVVYFSGHGIKDESSKLHLATRFTRKNPQGRLVKSTAVPASFIHNIMSESRCKRQVVILDCCFSGAFAEGWSAKDDGSVNIQAELGGEGRVVLTSSTATQYSFQQQGENLSTYTRYLVQGIETGAADLDNDGVVSVDELHEYAKKRVQEAAPAMQPEIYAVKEGFKILLAKAPIGDPKLKYRQEVELYASRGEISIIGRKILDALYQALELLPHEAAAIETEVLKPYREYQQKLQEYEQALIYALRREHSLGEQTQIELLRYQKILGLRDQDVAPIETKIVPPKESVPSPEKVPVSMEAKSVSLNEEVTPVKPVAVSQAETPAPNSVKPSGNFSTSVAVLKNHRLLFSAVGILTAVVLIFSFRLISHNDLVKSELSSAESANVDTYYWRGRARYGDGDKEGAITEFNRALQLDPNNADAYRQRGVAFGNKGDHKLALDDFNELIRLQPNNAFAYYLRGLAHSNLKDNNAAIKDFTQALQLDPNNADSYRQRGIAFGNEGDHKSALDNFNELIRLQPNNAFAYYMQGVAYFHLKDNKAAIEGFSQALKIYPNNADAYYWRGVALGNEGDNKAAIADYQKAANIYQQQRKTEDYQNALQQIQKLQ